MKEFVKLQTSQQKKNANRIRINGRLGIRRFAGNGAVRDPAIPEVG